MNCDCFMLLFFPVLAPVVILTQSIDGQNQLAGSNLLLTVDISVDNTTDTPYSIVTTWTRNGSVLSNNGRISVLQPYYIPSMDVYRAQTNFSTLSSALDSGLYTFGVEIITASSFAYLFNSSTSLVTVTITVSGKYLHHINCTFTY